MTDPDLWWCPRCQTSNAAGTLRCVVCDDARPTTTTARSPEPTPPQSAVLFAAPDAPTTVAPAAAGTCGSCGAQLRPGQPFCGNCGAAVGSAAAGAAPVATAVTPATPATASNKTWVWAVSTLVVVVAIATGVFVLTRPKAADDAQPVRTKDGATSTGADPTAPNVSTVDGTRTTLTAPTTAPTTAPATVITAPTTPPTTAASVRPAAERAPAGTATPVLDALDLAQELATALAHDDWALVRQLEPGKSNLTDAKFYAQYNDLDESTAILVSSSQQGSSHSLRLGLVAHQNGTQSSIYCVTWVVNPGARTVAESTTGTKTIVDHAPGTLDPLQQVDTIRARC